MMRNVNPHLLEHKMDEAMTHYINSHQPGEEVHVDGTMSLNVQDDADRVVTVLQSHGYTTQMNRQVSVSEPVEGAAWSEELLDPEVRLAALVAHLAQQSRAAAHHKVSSIRDVDSAEILDAPLRLFNGQGMDTQPDSIVVQVPGLPPLPPLQEMKRCQDTDWFSKDKNTLKENGAMLEESEDGMLELGAEASPAHKQHNKKSLPHKKRISRKLKRNTATNTSQQDIVVINCHEDVQQEEILPDSFVAGVQHQQHQQHLAADAHHIAHEVRPILLCQLCGEFYGEEQLKFYQHLKQHYEPHATIIIENPVADLAMDKMTDTCIEDNGAALPDSIVELSLESTVPKTVYQPIDKHILYTSSDKTLYTNKVLYSMAGMDKEPAGAAGAAGEDKADLYSLDKLEFYNCLKCNRAFRKQKQCEAHIRDAHGNHKLEDMGEFSEPEDLMEGINVTVEESADHYDPSLLPTITVDNGHVTQDHPRHWYIRGGAGAGGGALAACGAGGAYCPLCAAAPPPAPHVPPHAPHDPHDPHAPHAPPRHDQLKEEVLQRIFESDVAPEQPFADDMLPEAELEAPHEPSPPPEPAKPPPPDGKRKSKRCECTVCGRVFYHRNSLMYHLLSHRGKQHECRDCGKEFYTSNALKVHRRVHSDDRPYSCEECGRQFRQWSDLKYHKVSRHSNQKSFKCEYCGKDFARKYSLNVHRRIHTGEKNYKCDYCSKTFRASSYRLSHMRVHTGVRPYKCEVCEKAFRVPGDLRRHALTHDKLRAARPAKGAASLKQDAAPPAPPAPQPQPQPEPQPQIPTKVKKIAVASTSRPALLRKATPAKKTPVKKGGGGAPNVTVRDMKRGDQFRIIEVPVEVYDTRQDLDKFKVYHEDDEEYETKEYGEQILGYKDGEDRDLATLRPTMFRSGVCEQRDKSVVERDGNTDGKLTVFTERARPQPWPEQLAALYTLPPG